jgi:hypothetical protein
VTGPDTQGPLTTDSSLITKSNFLIRTKISISNPTARQEYSKTRASIVGETLALVNLALESCGARLRSYRALNAHTSPQRLLWDYEPKYLLVSLSKDTTLTYVAELMQESIAK